MQLYQHKGLKYCFLILATDDRPNLLKSTASSIKLHHQEAGMMCSAYAGLDKDSIESMRSVCPVILGGNTITSLINAGMKKATEDWVFIVFSGSQVMPRMNYKFEYFVTSEKDILFPVANRKINFIDGTMNGIFMHRNTFSTVGDMPNDDDIQLSKAVWAYEAINHGCVFKAIVGGKIC